MIVGLVHHKHNLSYAIKLYDVLILIFIRAKYLTCNSVCPISARELSRRYQCYLVSHLLLQLQFQR